MKKPQTDRALARRAIRNKPTATCPEHGHRLYRYTKFNQAHRYVCGCLTGEIRN